MPAAKDFRASFRQRRLVKATRERRWGKVKALQHLLPHSFSGKALAVKRVTGNKGKRTSGVDGALWLTPGPNTRPLDNCIGAGISPNRCGESISPNPMENFVRWESRRCVTARCRHFTCSRWNRSRNPCGWPLLRIQGGTFHCGRH
jgi:hypothetical protein